MSGEKGKIKLFADAHVFDNEYQGTRTYIKELYAQLAKFEDLEIYLGAYEPEKLADVFQDIPNIRFIKYSGKSAFTRLLYSIPEVISRYQIDFAHFQYILPPSKKCTYIVTIHDVILNEFPGEFSYPYRLSKKMLYRDAAKRADIVTTVSAYSKRSIQKYLGTTDAPIHIIPNGVSKRFFQPYNKEASKKWIFEKFGIDKCILYVSHFEPRKNHSGLLKAWLDLALYKQGYHLVLLGQQSLKVPGFDEIINGASEEAKQFVFIKRDIEDNELLEFYRAADVFVYPSRAEGFGISPLEAGAVATPVICSNISAMGDFSFFGEGHIDTAQQPLLKKKLADFVMHPPQAHRLKEISEIIRQRYDWEITAKKFHQILQHYHASPSHPEINFKNALVRP